MFDKKKKPHTFWQNNHWYMYNSMTDRNPHRSTLVTREEITNRLQDIETSKTYKTYSARSDADLQSAYAASSNTKQHERGFHRQVIAGSASNTFAIATLTAGLFLGALSRFPAFNNNPGARNAMDYLAFALACVSLLLIAIPKLFLDYNIQATADEEERKKQHFKNMEDLKERLPIVAQEIDDKEKVITALHKFFKKYSSSLKVYGKQARQNLGSSSGTLFNANQRDELFENLALALDRKDDLARYEKVFNALAELKNLSRLNQDTEFSKTLCLLLHGYLKEEFYEDNIEFFDSFTLPASLEDLISNAAKNIRLLNDVANANAENFPQANTLINVSQEVPVTQEQQALTLTKIYDYFINIMQDSYKLLAAQQLLKLAESNNWNELDVIGVFASLDATSINYKTLATNIEALNSEPSCLSRLLRKIEGKDENDHLTKFNSLREAEQAKLFKKLLKVLSTDNAIDKFVPNQNLSH
ncbi:MAG: hypothetical protein K0S11_1084 [Gammaproteobacteria bacterium]|nr:hypothetical protein [Gammaproteobacteria bacterium]